MWHCLLMGKSSCGRCNVLLGFRKSRSILLYGHNWITSLRLFFLFSEKGIMLYPAYWDTEIYVWKLWHQNYVLSLKVKWRCTKTWGNGCAIKILTPDARSGLNFLRYSCGSFSSGMGKYCFADKHCDVVNVQNLMKSIITDENAAFISLWMPYSF